MTTAPVTKKNIFNRSERPYVNPYLGGMVLGIILFLALFLTGNGLGSSGGTTRLVAFIENQLVRCWAASPPAHSLEEPNSRPLRDPMSRIAHAG